VVHVLAKSENRDARLFYVQGVHVFSEIRSTYFIEELLQASDWFVVGHIMDVNPALWYAKSEESVKLRPLLRSGSGVGRLRRRQDQ
jgi:hypothetical protein